MLSFTASIEYSHISDTNYAQCFSCSCNVQRILVAASKSRYLYAWPGNVQLLITANNYV